MPPKKEPEPKKILLGRPGNNVKIGVVGMPNVGKSSLFNLLSGLQVPAENYPFCTLDPNTAVVPVPDPRFEYLCEAWQPKSKVPAVLSITDIAGLVKGAAEGKGLGNAFLSHIQAVDAIYHVTRAFKDKDIEHVEGSVDPVRDLEIIRGELIAKDLERMKTEVSGLEKKCRASKDKALKETYECAQKVAEMLEAGREVRHGDWNNKDIAYLNTLQLLTAKPVVYLVNISLQNFIEQKNPFLKAIKDWVNQKDEGAVLIPFSVKFEQGLFGKSEEERAKILADAKVPSMIPRIITNGYRSLNLINFFTTGADEVRAWTIKYGTKAPQAAGVIHGDFEEGFICADVYAYDDFKEHKSESAVKAAGKLKTNGKEYEVKDGDIIFFKANAGGGKKKK